VSPGEGDAASRHCLHHGLLPMNLPLTLVVVVVTAGVAIVAMLLVRRRAPEGGYFQDGDRASGVFGVLGTGFSVLLGFIVFLSFESFDASRAGAITEAETLVQQYQTAQSLPQPAGAELAADLICYG